MTKSKVFSGPARPNSDKERFILRLSIFFWLTILPYYITPDRKPAHASFSSSVLMIAYSPHEECFGKTITHGSWCFALKFLCFNGVAVSNPDRRFFRTFAIFFLTNFIFKKNIELGFSDKLILLLLCFNTFEKNVNSDAYLREMKVGKKKVEFVKTSSYS